MKRTCIALVTCGLIGLIGCDFKNPVSKTKVPFKKELVGTWKLEQETVTIAKGKKADTYAVKHHKAKKENGATVEETMEFIGWLSTHKKRTYFNLQQFEDGEGDMFIIAEIVLKKDTIQFNRINRDFPKKYNPGEGGDVGNSGLSSAQLVVHIDKNRDKANFFESKKVYKRAKATATK